MTRNANRDRKRGNRRWGVTTAVVSYLAKLRGGPVASNSPSRRKARVQQPRRRGCSFEQLEHRTLLATTSTLALAAAPVNETVVVAPLVSNAKISSATAVGATLVNGVAANKSGTTTLKLTGANTSSGTVNIETGVLTYNGTSSTIAATGALQLSGINLAKSGTSTIVLSGGTLQASLQSNTTVFTASTLTINGTLTSNSHVPTSGTGSITLNNGTAPFTLSGDVPVVLNGSTTAGGTLVLTGATTTITATTSTTTPITVTPIATLPIVTGTGGLTISGTGGTVINAGTLVTLVNSGASSVTLNSCGGGTILAPSSGSTVVLVPNSTLTNTTVVSSTGTLQLSSTLNTLGSSTLVATAVK
jgi:hypothetical protein